MVTRASHFEVVFRASFDHSWFGPVGSIGDCVQSDGREQCVAQIPCGLATGIGEGGLGAQEPIESALEGESPWRGCGGQTCGFKHEGSQQIVGEQEGANDFPGHGWGFGIHKLHPHGGFDVLEGQLHAPPGMVDTGNLIDREIATRGDDDDLAECACPPTRCDNARSAP